MRHEFLFSVRDLLLRSEMRVQITWDFPPISPIAPMDNFRVDFLGLSHDLLGLRWDISRHFSIIGSISTNHWSISTVTCDFSMKLINLDQPLVNFDRYLRFFNHWVNLDRCPRTFLGMFGQDRCPYRRTSRLFRSIS
jgi:hypothetical protein